MTGRESADVTKKTSVCEKEIERESELARIRERVREIEMGGGGVSG